MKYELVKIEELCGEKLTTYSIASEGNDTTIFEEFLSDYSSSHTSEINQIVDMFVEMKERFGAREIYFKSMQGSPSSQLVRLKHKTIKELRVYCIKLGKSIIIVGGGGVKPSDKKALQEVPELKKQNYFTREISKELESKIKNKEITYNSDYTELLGELFLGEENE